MIINILKISQIYPIKKQNKINKTVFKADTVSFQALEFDRKVLEKRQIISNNESLDKFFKRVSNKIFKSKNSNFIKYLNSGKITLSTNAYSNLDNPRSATAIDFADCKSDSSKLVAVEHQIKDGIGIGINFNSFNNPKDEIEKINSYMKYREKGLLRPPAAIGLLDINHPKILDFITLKNDADYKDWCFDLSVILDKNFIEKVDSKNLSAQNIYNMLLISMLKAGEPGIIFSSNPDYLCDCCAAAPLKINESLTLGHINLSKFVSNGKIDFNDLKSAVDILSLAMKKIDKNSYIGILGYQEMLDKLGLKYGDENSLEILEEIMKTIQQNVHKNGLKTAISPTGNISRFLKTTPSIEPRESDYIKELETMKVAQKYLDGNISKTILLDETKTTKDVDKIIRYCLENNLRGISVFPVK